MAILNNAGIYYESGQSQQSFAAMTNSGDQTTFSLPSKPWSNAAGYEYVIAPAGMLTGGAVTPHASADKVVSAALTAMMPWVTGASATTGVLSVAADTDIAITRGVSTDTHCITSITVDNSGAIVPVAGTDGTAFSETRGANGGPPLIPVSSIEIAQVRTSSVTSAVITQDEIYQIVGVSQERADYPVYQANPLAGTVTFADALPESHTGPVAKRVYARVATPVFAEIPRARDWVSAENSNSVTSEQYYDGTIGALSSSLGQATFTASLTDGITDAVVGKVGLNLIFKFMPDKNKVPYELTQGVLGMTKTNAAGANPSGSFTVTPELPTARFSS